MELTFRIAILSVAFAALNSCSNGNIDSAKLEPPVLLDEKISLTYCFDKGEQELPYSCGINGRCIGFSDNEIPGLYFVTRNSVVRVKKPFGDTTSRDVVVDSRIVEKIKTYGEYLGIFNLYGDTLILLNTRGFTMFTRDNFIGSWHIGSFVPENYFFTSPSFVDRSLAFINDKVFFLVGGEWDYPYKKYSSDMRYVFEFDISKESGRILNFTNPDFGDNYQVLQFANLSAVHGTLLTSYYSDSTLYLCDFESEKLEKIVFPPARLALPNTEYKQAGLATFSDVFELNDGKTSFRAGVLPIHVIEQTKNVEKKYLPFIEYFDQNLYPVRRDFSEQVFDNKEVAVVCGANVYWTSPCHDKEDQDSCVCYLRSSISPDGLELP